MIGIVEVSESKDVWIAPSNFKPTSGVTIDTIWNSNIYPISVQVCLMATLMMVYQLLIRSGKMHRTCSRNTFRKPLLTDDSNRFVPEVKSMVVLGRLPA